MTPLMYAARGGHLEIVKEFMKYALLDYSFQNQVCISMCPGN